MHETKERGLWFFFFLGLSTMHFFNFVLFATKKNKQLAHDLLPDRIAAISLSSSSRLILSDLTSSNRRFFVASSMYDSTSCRCSSITASCASCSIVPSLLLSKADPGRGDDVDGVSDTEGEPGLPFALLLLPKTLGITDSGNMLVCRYCVAHQYRLV